MAASDQRSVGGIGLAFSLTLPADTVVDQDGEPLVYQAMGFNDSPLPNWLSFNPQSLTFLGVPLETNLGALPIQLTVTDPADASVQDNFTVNVIHFPTVTVALPTPSKVWSGQTFIYSVPTTTFSDPDHLIQSYQAILADGEALPAWLQFNANALVFSGVPSDDNAGTLSIRVIAQVLTNPANRAAELHRVSHGPAAISQSHFRSNRDGGRAV